MREKMTEIRELAEKVTKELIRRKRTITFMESCTSGLLASLFTDTEGASEVFFGSYVTYANREKIRAGVAEEIIDTRGVYSSECARAMAEAARTAFGTDLAVGITGSTGNTDPNNQDSVPGEVFFCILVGEEAHSTHLEVDVSSLTRREIKYLYAYYVYKALWELLCDKGDGSI